MPVVFLGLGANLGDRLANLQIAVQSLARAGTVRKVSSLYETAAVGPEQPMFYNAVCEIETELEPRELLAITQEIQREMGRPDDDERWGPRLIDIDILLFGREVMEEDGLVGGFNGSRSRDVMLTLHYLFAVRGAPEHLRSDNGPEFIAEAVQKWIKAVGAKTAYIVPGSPWENGYCESFKARFRDELLNGEIFYSLKEAQIIIEEWRKHYNTKRPHSALGYRPPAPETIVPLDQRPVMH